MLKELQALRTKQQKHDEEMEDLKRAHLNTTTLEPHSNLIDEESELKDSSRRKSSAIEEFTVNELIAQL